MKLYKITDKYKKTMNECHWGEGVTHKAKGKGSELCSGDFIHAYRNPYMAIFHNPVGGNYDENKMLLWEARGRVVKYDGMKVGCRTLTTVRKIEKPILTTEQRVEIGIRCALEVHKEKGFIEWAKKWLSGEDRSGAAAGAAARAAWAAGAAGAVDAASWAAARAAEAAGAVDADPNLNIIAIIRQVVEKEG